MQPVSPTDPAALAATLAQEVDRLCTAVRHIQAAEQAATQATEAAARIVQSAQVRDQQQETTLAEVAQQLTSLTHQLGVLQPQLKSIEEALSRQPAVGGQPANSSSSVWMKAGLVVAVGVIVLQASLPSRAADR